MVMEQYPHQLWINTLSEQPAKDGDGDFLPVADNWQLLSPCREQVGGRGSLTILADGQAVKTTGVIHMPLTCPDVAIGSQIQVRTNQGQLRRQAQVINVDSGQLHKRLWV